MDKSISVTTLFVDIGGVLLTDGWGHEFRKLAVKKFHLNQQKIISQLAKNWLRLDWRLKHEK